jgi:phage shock protein A
LAIWTLIFFEAGIDRQGKNTYFCENLEKMAKELAEQLERLGHKAELLVTRYETLRRQNDELRRRLEEMQAALLARDAQIQKLEMQAEHTRISAALAATPADVQAARSLISSLVREIDDCVADLTRDV